MRIPWPVPKSLGHTSVDATSIAWLPGFLAAGIFGGDALLLP
jgi:hypothetical protein